MSNTKDPHSSGLAPGVGSDRGWFESLDLEGNSQSYDETFDPEIHNMRTVGCHKGHMAGLNVVNSDPGFHYQWVRDTVSDDRVYKLRGFEPVLEDSQERAASSMQAGASSSPDSLVRYGELVLYRCPMQKYREYQEGLAEESTRRLLGGEAQFAAGITDAERASSPRGPSRFARRDHRIEVRDGLTDNSRIRNQWTPDKGIIEEG